MPVKSLPEKPNLKNVEDDAADLLRAHAARDVQAAARIREFHPKFPSAAADQIFAAALSLADAQLTIARESGFENWARLTQFIANLQPQGIHDQAFRRAVELLDAGDAEGLQAHLKDHPHLALQRVSFEGVNYSRNPALLAFVAENPVRRGSLPANIVALAKIVLEAGAKSDQAALNETLVLVASGRVPRECALQQPLIDLLCAYGADPDSALPAALVHGEFAAVNALLSSGAHANLLVAAASGCTADARTLLPTASDQDRHRALALASQFGHTEIVRLLLDAGEDPSRYNPVGFHSHSTPLHQAALGGHTETVHLLVDRGARIGLKDALWQATPAGWAKHAGKMDIEEYLRGLEN